MPGKVYIIDNLDCANCAAKIEKKFNDHEAVQEAIITFSTKQLRLTAEDPDALIPELVRIARSVESGVEIHPRDSANSHHRHNHGCNCGHHHDHDEHHECKCGHHHDHEEHHECKCWHHHDHEEHHECSCGHHHGHEEHHECSCGHHHDHTDVPTGAVRKVYLMENLGCANCAAKMEAKFNALPQVQEATITFATKQLRLTAADPDALIPELTKIACSVEQGIVIHPLVHKHKDSREQFEAGTKRAKMDADLAELLVGTLLFAGILILGIVSNVLSMWGISINLQGLVKGLVILVAVLIQRVR